MWEYECSKQTSASPEAVWQRWYHKAAAEIPRAVLSWLRRHRAVSGDGARSADAGIAVTELAALFRQYGEEDLVG